MTEQARHERNRTKLGDLHPWLRPKVDAILGDLEGHGFRPRIQRAWVSREEQREAYSLGHSKLLWGFHNALRPDGRPGALAVDIVDDNAPYAEDRRFLLMLAASARAHGLETGIRFGLTVRQIAAVMKAVDERRWTFAGPIGWDSWHVQPRPVTLTVAQARAGKRPG